MRRLIVGSFLIALLGLLGATQAKADGVDTFMYTFGGNTFSWQLAASPTPSTSYPGDSFYINVPDFFENGVQLPAEGFAFYETSQGGGFAAPPGGGILNAFGPVLYTGGELTPTFSLGTFYLENGSADGPMGTLVISGPGAATPEPGALLLLGTGLLGLGVVRKKLA